MSKMLTQDELQYIEHCNKLLKETRGLITEVEREVKQGLDIFLPILGEYVNGIRTIQHDLLRVVSEILKSSKELKFVAGNHQELEKFAGALYRLGEVFKTQEVQDVLEIVRKANVPND